MSKFFIFLFLIFTINFFGQDLIMQNGSVTACSGSFYDSGGPNGNYSSFENYVYTICPDIIDNKVSIEFLELFLNSSTDSLIVYDGQDTNATVLKTFDGSDNFDSTDNSIVVLASENNMSGCLTFQFTSDAFFNNSGWFAEVNCIPSCESTTAALGQIIPSLFNPSTLVYEIEIFQPISISINPFFSANNGSSPTYVWDFGDGNSIQSTTTPVINYTYNSFGIYTLSISIIDDFGCNNENVLQIPISVQSPLGSYCSDARELCLDSQSSFILFTNFNDINGGLLDAEQGPDYGCLGIQPYPNWFYFQVQSSGDLAFTIEQNSDADLTGIGLDTDFKIWGPFSSPFGNCDNLNVSTEVPDLPNGSLFDGCSYSATPIENMGVENAQAGEYYIFVVTNFSQDPGFIKIEQININDAGSGSIECNDDLLGDDIIACGSSPVTVMSNEDNAVSYTWEIFNTTTNAFELLSGETSQSLIVNPPGGYFRLTVDTGNVILSDEILVVILNEPVYQGSPVDLEVCSNGITSVDLTVNNLSALGVINPNLFNIYYFNNQQDAVSGNYSMSIPQNEWSNYEVTNSENIFIRIENSSDPLCFTVLTFFINVILNPQVTSPDPLIECVSNSDFAFFDLTTSIPQIVGSANDLAVTFHENQSDADTNNNVIAVPTNYGNITNPQILYFRAEDMTLGCYTTGTLELIVDECFNINDINTELNLVNIYPNPIKNKLVYIENKSSSINLESFSIFNISGKLVYKQNAETAKQLYALDLSRLGSGVYFLKIESNDRSIIKKIILR
jgi:hypothetical protein